MDLVMDRTTSALKWLLIVLMLPLPAASLAVLSLTTRYRIAQLQIELSAEVASYAGFVAELQAAEQQLADALLRLRTPEAQQQAILGHEATVGRIQRQFAASVPLAS